VPEGRIGMVGMKFERIRVEGGVGVVMVEKVTVRGRQSVPFLSLKCVMGCMYEVM
jgi:hypothetical protein